MNIQPIIAQFHLQTNWFLHALENITDEESNIRFSENHNPVKWIAGHITHSRMTIFSIATGNAPHPDYHFFFGKGSSAKIDHTFPTIEQIKSQWILISPTLKTGLQNLPEEKLKAPPPFQTSIPDETLLGLIAYFAIHESFHIGQISMYRKLLGKTAMLMSR